MSAKRTPKKKIGRIQRKPSTPPASTELVAESLASKRTGKVLDKGDIRFIELSKIQLDPEQPRKHAITIADIEGGIDAKDEDRAQKVAELEEIENLAQSIDPIGLIQPVTVTPHPSGFLLLVGERRLLAHHFLKMQTIKCLVNPQNIKGADRRLIQIIENSQRLDLSLAEFVSSIREFGDLYKKEHQAPPKADYIMTHFGVKKSSAYTYVAIMKASAAHYRRLIKLIEVGKINGIKEAGRIAGLPSNARGAELDGLEEGKPPKPKSFSMGKTTSPHIVGTFLELACGSLDMPEQLRSELQNTDLDSTKSVKESWGKLLEFLEQNENR